MRIAKSCFAVICAFVLMLALCSLTACGDVTAAKWAHGKVTEEEVTNQITSMQSNEGYSSDKSGWEKYIKTRGYDDSADSKSKDGTVAQLREYVVKDLVKQQILDYEVEKENIEVSDEEVDAYYDQQAQIYEQMYAGGLSGTFDSILEMMGYENADSFKDELRKQLKEEAYKKQVCGEDYTDEDWDKYLEGLYGYAEVNIKDCPSDLTYDPANMTDAASDTTSDSSTSSEK